MNLTRSGGHSIDRRKGDILTKYQRQSKALKEKKKFFRNQRVSKMYLLQTLVHSDAEDISTDLLSRKMILWELSGIKSADTVDYSEISTIYGTPQKH